MYQGKLQESPLGRILAVSDGHALVGIWFVGQKHDRGKIKESINMEGDTICDAAIEWLDGYFRGERTEFSIPLNPLGTPFQKSVWKKLLEIPYGEVTTYGQIAQALAKEKGIEKMSARAVGNAVSRNPISILVPCHRVVGKGNSLTGYAGGLERKKWLLKFERKNKSKASHC